jgi:hypothetical protein
MRQPGQIETVLTLAQMSRTKVARTATRRKPSPQTTLGTRSAIAAMISTRHRPSPRALLRVESLPSVIWEPACGPGSIVGILREHGHRVIATDLVEYFCPDSTSRVDFPMEHRAPEGVESIVTTPPYKNAEAFVAKALQLVPKVVMLLRLAFLESERRRPIIDTGDLARV